MTRVEREERAERERACMLWILYHAQPNRPHPGLMVEILGGVYGLMVTQDKIRTELAWLEEQGYVDIEVRAVESAGLTARGADLVQLKKEVPGVACIFDELAFVDARAGDMRRGGE